MNSSEYLEKMTNIQQNLLKYIDNEDSTEDSFTNFKDFLSIIKIQDNKHELKSFLHLLTNISNNHHHTDNFYHKIDRILELLQNDFLKFFSNVELFLIFKSNKRILLFLFEEKILNFDEFIGRTIIGDKYINKKYPQYFQPEIQPFIKKQWFPKYEENEEENFWFLEIQKKIPEDFYERRKIGENESLICQLIRKDLLDDFIVYVNENNYNLDSTINPSIFETNDFLLIKKNNFLIEKRITTLIEYAAFFGSIQIFNYLRLKNISLTPSLWNYAIHGNNAEIIQILEENQVELPDDESYIQILKESIKCHHNDFVYYIHNNFFENKEEDLNSEIISSLKYYNFILIENEKINETLFNYICKYDYYILVFIFLKTTNIDINKTTIKNI